VSERSASAFSAALMNLSCSSVVSGAYCGRVASHAYAAASFGTTTGIPPESRLANPVCSQIDSRSILRAVASAAARVAEKAPAAGGSANYKVAATLDLGQMS
jgi:hypothetical protein